MLRAQLTPGLTIKGVYKSGYAVLAATAISTLYLAFFV
jgi:succinate dehydrogenase (ubiquinone) cytochrome b560 subunit